MYPTISTTPIKTWDNRWRSWLRHHIHSFRSVSIPPNSTLPVFKPGTLAEEDGCWLILFLFFWLITAFHSRVTFCVKLAYSAPFTCLLLSRIRFLWCFLFDDNSPVARRYKTRWSIDTNPQPTDASVATSEASADSVATTAATTVGTNRATTAAPIIDLPREKNNATTTKATTSVLVESTAVTTTAAP